MKHPGAGAALMAIATMAIAGSALVACALVIDTNDLTGGDASVRDATHDVYAEAGPAPLFAEDWENGASRWNPEPVLDQETCSTTFQRETILSGGGRVFDIPPLAVTAGEALCIVAWVRGSSGTQPFLGILVDDTHHWLIGRDGYDNGYDGTATAVTSDGAWHWYSASFTLEVEESTVVVTDELYKDGEGGTADFDDIRVYAGDCPTTPTGAAHVCP